MYISTIYKAKAKAKATVRPFKGAVRLFSYRPRPRLEHFEARAWPYYCRPGHSETKATARQWWSSIVHQN